MNRPVIYKPLKRRFYVLFTFCMLTFICGLIWNSWQPLIISTNELYNWNNSEINLLNNIYAMVFCVLIIPFILLWNKFGIKFCYTTSTCIILIGCLVRLYPCDVKVQSTLLPIGNSISAYGNMMAYVGSTAISALWFPTNERSRSTCTSLAFSNLGTVTAPIAASQIVPTFNRTVANSTEARAAIELGMRRFMFFHTSIAMFVLVLIIIYFPSKPKYMPCKSSERSLRIDLKSGFLELIKNKQFWIVFVVNFILSGVNGGVTSVIPSIIVPLGFSQKEIGFITAVGNLSIFIGALIGGWLGDKYSYKKIVLLSIPPTAITYILFGLQSLKYLRYGIGEVYAVIIAMALVSNITLNISFEMGCEVTFPTGEEITTAILGFATNFGTACILAVTVVTNENVNWIPFFYAGLVVLVLPLMYFYNDERKRFTCDYGLPQQPTFTIQTHEETQEPETKEFGDDLEECSLLRFPA